MASGDTLTETKPVGAKAAPPFRAEHVGSFLRPPELQAARQSFKKGEMSKAEFRLLQDKAVKAVVKVQEELGFEAVTDGEIRRDSWHLDFTSRLANVAVIPPKLSVRFHTREGDIDFAPPSLEITGKLGRPSKIFVDDFIYLESVTRAVPKQTIPSPTMLHFRGGRAAVSKDAYPEMDEFYADLAAVYREEIADYAAAGCRYLQIDETNLAYLCDPALRAEVATKFGEDPSRLVTTYAALLNDTIRDRPADMVVGMHLCRGNNESAWVAEGGYEPVAEVLFNGINIDAYFLEYDSPRAGDFAPLRFVPKGKTVVLGLVTTKVGQMESKDEIKRRIDEAAKYVPLDQLALSPQCGFSSTSAGNKISYDDQVAKLRFVREVAREVWG